MYTNNNCHSKSGGSPAQAAPTPLQSQQVNDLLTDFFTSSIEVQSIRRDLRRWFLANVIDWQNEFGSPLSDQIQHYEVLDELLHEISVALTQNASEQ